MRLRQQRRKKTKKIDHHLAKTVKSFPKHEFLIVGGDFNAKLTELTDEEHKFTVNIF